MKKSKTAKRKRNLVVSTDKVRDLKPGELSGVAGALIPPPQNCRFSSPCGNDGGGN